MFPLIETIIGFSVIMLLLSLLIKTMTSVVKNHVDYYSENLKIEVGNLINEVLEKKIEDTPLKNFRWKRLGEEFLSRDNMTFWLKKLGAGEDALKDIEARLEVHKQNLRYLFAKRTNNIALMLGLGVCLFLNINAFSIWQTLYTDQQIRTKFSSDNYVSSALNMLDKYEKEIEKGTENNLTRAELEEQRDDLRKKVFDFQEEVNFGVGRIWRETKLPWWPDLFYEFLGSLLTGILVSIGAPYWHDLLTKLAAVRKPREEVKIKP